MHCAQLNQNLFENGEDVNVSMFMETPETSNSNFDIISQIISLDNFADN